MVATAKKATRPRAKTAGRPTKPCPCGTIHRTWTTQARCQLGTDAEITGYGPFACVRSCTAGKRSVHLCMELVEAERHLREVRYSCHVCEDAERHRLIYLSGLDGLTASQLARLAAAWEGVPAIQADPDAIEGQGWHGSTYLPLGYSMPAGYLLTDVALQQIRTMAQEIGSALDDVGPRRGQLRVPLDRLHQVQAELVETIFSGDEQD